MNRCWQAICPCAIAFWQAFTVFSAAVSPAITYNSAMFFNVRRQRGPVFDPLGLQFNGGPTPTFAILQTSAAIDAIPLNQCTDQNGKRLKTDQRGFTRPAPKHAACDIGAFEYKAKPSRYPKGFQRRRLHDVRN